jgi:hypothetical protein
MVLVTPPLNCALVTQDGLVLAVTFLIVPAMVTAVEKVSAMEHIWEEKMTHLCASGVLKVGWDLGAILHV